MAANSRWWMKLAVVLAVAGSTLTLFPPPAYACSCMETTLEEQADELDFAFVGTQIERELLDEFEENGVRLVFDVNRVYKGNVTTPFEVFTDAQGCGVIFEENVVTAVVGSQWQGKLNVDQCGQLLDLSDEELTATFGTRVAPAQIPLAAQLYYEEESAPWLWIVLASVAGSAAAAGFVARLAKRRDV